MPLSNDILDILVCPVCKQSLHYTSDQTGLQCDVCKLIYPIRDEIPCMLPEEATPVSE
jgi:uncharacterized protein YbaR (Trm112 family)